MSAHHTAADCSQVFDGDNVTYARLVKPEQREALELLGHPTHGWVRLTVAQWDVVERIVRALRAASASVSASEGADGYLGGSGSTGTAERRTA